MKPNKLTIKIKHSKTLSAIAAASVGAATGHVGAAADGADGANGIDTGTLGGAAFYTCLLYTSPSPRD